MSTCSKCQARIIWRKTRSGAWMPLDEEPLAYIENPEGKEILFDINGDAIRCDIVERKPGVDPNRTARRAHWATCPFAKEFKGKKGVRSR